ncbi:unnamed protein product [Acanthoscelides obtectus]|uniref:Uncharacterized protein n=1 Tax=Acanthoscelides obtectus TaxID=200917 RepID=A0A9P0PCH4_ACAOB|nr:unnamed protein product [Acanthoscelides obtectus]CAK1665159.1 hypothetical protein AOBTE_LOCUS24690 [Acanthoscelides obtectus]
MILNETTKRSRSSCQLLIAGQARDRHSRKLNIQKWKKLCTCEAYLSIIKEKKLLVMAGYNDSKQDIEFDCCLYLVKNYQHNHN